MMKFKIAILAAGALFLVACSNDMNAGDYTFACDESTPCGEGYFCSPSGVCVENGTDVSVADTADDTGDTADINDTADTTDADDTTDAADTTDADDTGETNDVSDAEETSDDTCTPTTWYRDRDDDGFGDPDDTQQACESPGADWVDIGLDCDDEDERANPNQTQYFTEPAVGGEFDYDCNGTADKESTAVATCEVRDLSLCTVQSGDSCRLTGDAGWADVPDCGESGTWIDECARGCFDDCAQARTGTPRTQACR